MNPTEVYRIIIACIAGAALGLNVNVAVQLHRAYRVNRNRALLTSIWYPGSVAITCAITVFLKAYYQINEIPLSLGEKVGIIPITLFVIAGFVALKRVAQIQLDEERKR